MKLNNKLKNILFSLCFISTITILSCGDDNSGKPEFDRSEFLDYYANDLLKPRMGDLEISFKNLLASIELLRESPTTNNLIDARQKYVNAGLKWQRANFLNFGPGAKDGLRLTLQEELALWPLNESVIELKISSQDYALDDSWRNSRGLMTIEYLLYLDPNVDAALAMMDQLRLDYLFAISTKMNDQAMAFNQGWLTDYPSEFVANDGTDVKSSTTLLYNEWLRSYEVLKNMKITEPLGLKAGQVGPEPELVESPYAGLSLDFAKAHFANITEIYSGVDSIGWDDYLQSVEGGEALVSSTLAQISVVQQAFDQIPNDTTLKTLIELEHPTLLTLQIELQNLLPYFKSEMSSLLGLAITFSSSDGD